MVRNARPPQGNRLIVGVTLHHYKVKNWKRLCCQMDFSLFARQINTADVRTFLLVKAHQFSFVFVYIAINPRNGFHY